MNVPALQKNNLIVFVIRAAEQFHYHKTIVAALGARGYRVLVLFERKWSKGDSLELAEEYNISPYMKQILELTQERADNVFGREAEKQEGLDKWC